MGEGCPWTRGAVLPYPPAPVIALRLLSSGLVAIDHGRRRVVCGSMTEARLVLRCAGALAAQVLAVEVPQQGDPVIEARIRAEIADGPEPVSHRRRVLPEVRGG